MIVRVQVVTTSGKKNKVDIGSEVTIHANGVEHTYTVVGEFEADPLKKKISHDSPLGKALMGKKAGDTVEYEAPVGKVTYTVKKIN
jgi:transcription elongation factor GreA